MDAYESHSVDGDENPTEESPYQYIETQPSAKSKQIEIYEEGDVIVLNIGSRPVKATVKKRKNLCSEQWIYDKENEVYKEKQPIYAYKVEVAPGRLPTIGNEYIVLPDGYLN